MKDTRIRAGIAVALVAALAFVSLPARAVSPVTVYGIDPSGSPFNIPIVYPSGGLAVNTEGRKATYSASVTGKTLVATATDFFNIFGSATKTIRVTRIEISGEATASQQVDLQLIKRSTAGTLGSAALTALTKVAHDSANAAATATVNTVGTANYTTLGTIVGQVASRKFMLIAPTVPTTYAVSSAPLVFDFTNRNEQGIVLRGVAQQLALNWAGAAVPSGTTLDINITWTED